MSRIELQDLLRQGLIALNQPQNNSVENLLIRYIELISQWNRTYNLTAIRDLDAMITRHLLDSLSISPFVVGKRVLDVGTGAGLPGIPLAIIYPDKQFTLLDSNQKKTRFLQQVVYTLKLHNVKIVHHRIEEFSSEKFDIILSRAFSTLKDFIVMSKHLLHEQGAFLAMKGVYPLIELQEIQTPFKVKATHPLHVPRLEAERHVVEINLAMEA